MTEHIFSNRVEVPFLPGRNTREPAMSLALEIVHEEAPHRSRGGLLYRPCWLYL
jgi:hypothetical protein